MAIVVQKYGGSSVKDVPHIKNVAKRVVKAKRAGNKVIVVVSALGDTTDILVDLAGQITKNAREREMDMLLSTGEQVSIALLAMAIHELGEEAVSFTGYQVGIVTDPEHTKARIIDIDSKKIKAALKKHGIVIVAGFQGKTVGNEITTLGRGGSDLTAVALAASVKAAQCDIYTDVDGVFTTDPRIVSNARKLNVVSYEEMLELASLGAKVMHSRSIEVAKKYNVPIYVANSKKNTVGTLITKEEKTMEKVMVRGIALTKDEAKVTVFGVPDKPGVAASIFKTLAKNKINVDMIIQNKTTSGKTDISFTVPQSELKKTMPVVEKAAKTVKAAEIITDEKIAKVSVVGVGMRSHSGVAFNVFSALADEKINIDMISTSEIKISCVIDEKKAQKAVQVLHKHFKLHQKSSAKKKSVTKKSAAKKRK